MARIPFLNCRWGWKQLFVLGIAMALAWSVVSASGLPAADQSHDGAYVTVQAEAFTAHLEAYGQIEPSATLIVSFAEAGAVSGLETQPGDAVRAGQELARLVGPDIRLLLLRSEASVRRTRARLSESQKALVIQRQLFSMHRCSRQAVRQAVGTAARAQWTFDDARSHLRAVRQMMVLRAPVESTVLMTTATDGESVSAAQPILTLETPYRLWLDANYYGSNLSLIHAGMTGMFLPANASGSIPVQVCAVSASLSAGGGELITMVPADPGSQWIDGEFGTVMLNLPKRMLVAVPTRSLILDQGKWWVMVHTPQGDHPQAVLPGPSRGWETFLQNGLSPGAQVVVENAYLLFHRNISQRYQPPD